MNTPCKEERHTQSVRMCANCSFSRSVISISYRFRVTFFAFWYFFLLAMRLQYKVFSFINSMCVRWFCAHFTSITSLHYRKSERRRRRRRNMVPFSQLRGTIERTHFLLSRAKYSESEKANVCKHASEMSVCKHVFVHSFYCLVELRLEQRKNFFRQFAHHRWQFRWDQRNQTVVGVVIRPICRWFNIKWSMDD